MCSRLLTVSLILALVNDCYHGLVRVLYSSVDGSRLLIVALINGFHDGFRAVLLCRWKRIAHSSTHQRFSQWIAPHTAPRMAADCSADGSGLLIPPLVNGFQDGFRAVLLRGWQWIAHASARQWLSRQFTHRIAQRRAADCSFFLSSRAFPTVRQPYCLADCSGLLILLLVNGFHDGLRAELIDR